MTDRQLLTRFDKDSGRWRPYKYGVNILVPVTEGQWGEGTIQILNQPFVMNRISHGVVGNTNDYAANGLADDGQYYIEWKEEITSYQNQGLVAKEAYGTRDYPLLLPAPIGFAGNKVLTFRVSSTYTRVLTPDADNFVVNIVVHGIADLGPARRMV
jgi:hypothetical protein